MEPAGIRKNKEIGRNFETKVKLYLSRYGYTFKSGVSTNGLDVIAILKDNTIFLIETKVRNGEIYISELKNTFKNFLDEIERIITYTNLIPLPLIILKNKDNRKYGYYYILLPDIGKEVIYQFGAFKKLQTLIDFVVVNRKFLIDILYHDFNIEPVLENIIGLTRFNLKETNKIKFEL